MRARRWNMGLRGAGLLWAALTAVAACASEPRDFSNKDAGAGGSIQCTPQEIVVCYSGPLDTLNIGNCRAGTKICNDEGNGFSDCTGDVVPSPEM